MHGSVPLAKTEFLAAVTLDGSGEGSVDHQRCVLNCIGKSAYLSLIKRLLQENLSMSKPHCRNNTGVPGSCSTPGLFSKATKSVFFKVCSFKCT